MDQANSLGITHTTADGGELFYAYNSPQQYSSNTGFERDETAQILFVVDDDKNLHLILGLDAPQNQDGGYVKMEIRAPDLANKNVTIGFMAGDILEMLSVMPKKYGLVQLATLDDTSGQCLVIIGLFWPTLQASGTL